MHTIALLILNKSQTSFIDQLQHIQEQYLGCRVVKISVFGESFIVIKMWFLTIQWAIKSAVITQYRGEINNK